MRIDLRLIALKWMDCQFAFGSLLIPPIGSSLMLALQLWGFLVALVAKKVG